MSEHPRRGRQARNFTTNVPKILVLTSSSEQIFSRKLPLGAPVLYGTGPFWKYSRSLSKELDLLLILNTNTTTSVRISLVDSTVRNNLCHPSFDSNVKYESTKNYFTFEAISRWYFDFLIDKNGDQEVIAMFTS